MKIPDIKCPKCKKKTPANPYYDDWTCSHCKTTYNLFGINTSQTADEVKR